MVRLLCSLVLVAAALTAGCEDKKTTERRSTIDTIPAGPGTTTTTP